VSDFYDFCNNSNVYNRAIFALENMNMNLENYNQKDADLKSGQKLDLNKGSIITT
jgi:hypothetical protein